MQWRRQRRVIHVIGSSNHVLLLARYQDAPPGEEDEEDGLRNGFLKGQENETNTHSFSRQSGYKPRRSGSSDGGAYAGSAARHKDDTSGSPSQPKIIFNEDEYTRITTPRQDMLFKKGYLSRKKPWTGNANTSATSSTTESQSASHSTADGSETTEDQQLLDRDCGTGEYPPVMDSSAQLGYGTFYDHMGGYYYEYPVMLVGPAPMQSQVAPSVLAAVPCAPVPLRPIEWINPTYVPKLPDQPYCIMNYENNQSMESSRVVMEEEGNAILATENSNGMSNESGTGSTSCSGSMAGETEEQGIEFSNAKEEERADEQMEEQMEERMEERYGEEEQQQAEEQPLENGGGPYFEPMLMQQPVHVSHVIPAIPQPYMYPGHYMFGPPLINVNGVTIQGGPMIRTTDVAAMSAACAKRRKKKKRRKQRRLATGNTEDEEEGEYSSECDTGLPSSRLSWTACSTSTTNTTTISNRPLNPECQEFQLRQVVELNTSLPAISTSFNDTPTSEMSSTINQPSALSTSDTTSVDNDSNEVCNGVVSDDSKNQNDKSIENSKSDHQLETILLENGQSKSLGAITNSVNESTNRLTNCLLENKEEAALLTNEVAGEATEIEKLPSTSKTANNESSSANEISERSTSNETNGEIPLVNGQLGSNSSSSSSSSNKSTSLATNSRPLSPNALNDEKTRSRSRSITPKSVENTVLPISEDRNHESCLSNIGKSSSSTNLSMKRKYAKGAKFVREATPGPDLSNTAELENETKIHELAENMEKIDSKVDPCGDNVGGDDEYRVSSKFDEMKMVRDRLSKEEAIEATNEDSGFESQTQLSDYPIMKAVTEWLRREKSPDLFITSAISMDCEEDEDDVVGEEPPKNLQGNPMPALSVNSGADNAALSRAASCGEFAGISNMKGGQEQQQPEVSGNSGVSRRRKDAKRRSEARRRVARHVLDGKIVDHEAVSSSDSCGQQEELVNITRKKNLAKQQQDVVGEICEFTETDSVAGMRVALNSRMDSKRVNARRTKRQGRSHARNPSRINIDTKIQCIEDVDDENDEGIANDEDTMNVRTFEKGEIVVTEDGKLLTSSTYDPNLRNHHDPPTVIKLTLGKSEPVKEEKTIDYEKLGKTRGEELKGSSSSIEDEETGSRIGSLDSIEEPDVLECWEAEIIEPVITPKRILQSEGIQCDGEAAEDDNIEIEQVNLDYVQKYYRLARESASIEGISLKEESPSSSKSVPNRENEEKNEIQTQKMFAEDKSNIPIDEAFEVYESCYTGNSPFLAIDSNVFKSRTLYGQEAETPIPCKAVCCRIQ